MHPSERRPLCFSINFLESANNSAGVRRPDNSGERTEDPKATKPPAGFKKPNDPPHQIAPTPRPRRDPSQRDSAHFVMSAPLGMPNICCWRESHRAGGRVGGVFACVRARRGVIESGGVSECEDDT